MKSYMKALLPCVVLSVLLESVALPARADDDPADAAWITVRLPARASLTFDDFPIRQLGKSRVLVTPPLEKGKTYIAELAASWTEHGQVREVVRKIRLKAGARIEVDMTAPAMPIDPPPAPPAPPPAQPPAPRKLKLKQARTDPAKTDAPQSSKVKSRTFLFTYSVTAKDLPPGKEADVWLPFPRNTTEQEVSVYAKDLPAPEKIAKEAAYGNHILHVRAMADASGQIPLKLTFRVTRREVLTDPHAEFYLKPRSTEKISRFLEADAMVPIGGKGLTLIAGKSLPQDQFAAAKILYDAVNGHMTYSKEGKGWGRGDSDWACDSKFGNCTDFHSLFISLSRAQKIPAKFEMGFPIPPERGEGKVGGYHCWAWFMPHGKGWVPVDISEANRHPKLREYYFGNLTEDRVMFSTGRDINLVPPQKGPALNFFIYPYVEVDGQPYAAEKVVREFSYKDVP